MAIIVCEKTKTKACYFKFSIGGKIAHNYDCKCKIHIQGYIEHFATTKELESAKLKIEGVSKPKCKRCKRTLHRTQRNTLNTSVWTQDDGSVIVRN